MQVKLSDFPDLKFSYEFNVEKMKHYILMTNQFNGEKVASMYPVSEEGHVSKTQIIKGLRALIKYWKEYEPC